ncbi:unnamed protein product [Larinioides sclopetarius]|uniref:Uncharacterized protein n=1 Tax=Larinioides sclopetarius TaxID=280406 RepID=A0AAV2BR73_9ARAC
MASLIAVLLFAILFSFNKNVCCLSDSNQEVNSIFTKNSLDTLLVKPEEPEATPSLKAKMQTLIENMLENITQTEISMGRNVSFNESTTSEEDHGILRGHKNLQNEYTTPTESSDYEDDYHTVPRKDTKDAASSATKGQIV